MQPPMRQGRADDFQTPKEAIYPLLNYIDKDKIVWEPACGIGNLVNEFKRLGYEVIGTDINMNPKFDFLTFKPNNFDVIVTNPPYSLKDKFLERCYELKKPFALLLPLTTFEGIKRQRLFKKYGVQVIFFKRRINFVTPSGEGQGSWFMTAWFTHGLNLNNDLNWFENYD